MSLDSVFSAFTRKKILDDVIATPLRRMLNVFDLTAIGVGATLGVGIYVLAGEVAKTTAGPAVALSFCIAGFASVLAAICYAEFGVRVPRAGSAYVYSYVTIGELVAFIIGWNLVLEYCIGAASVARGLSTYVDSIFGNVMADWLLETMPMNSSLLSKYPDLFAGALTMTCAIGLAFGVKQSSLVNNLFTLLNVSVVLYVIICGGINADIKNWNLVPGDDYPDAGTGGFFPFGAAGVIKGAANCFYAFVGFDSIATAGEEARNPKKTIPWSIVIALSIVSVAYFGVSSVLTLMWPYYLQSETAPLPYVFDQIGWHASKWIVTIGAIFGLVASLFGAFFPLPRILYAMSSDGLLFGFLGRINPRFQTPTWGTLFAGLVTASMSTVFELTQLVSMQSIGTLMAYSIVAACVTLLRFKEVATDNTPPAGDSTPSGFMDVVRQIVNYDRHESTTKLSEKLVTWLLVIFCIGVICDVNIIVWWQDGLFDGDPAAITVLTLTSLVLVIILVIIWLQPRSNAELTFKVPFVPFIPGISIFINLFLMMALDAATWWRFLVWMIIGFSIYFGFGVFHSEESPRKKNQANPQT